MGLYRMFILKPYMDRWNIPTCTALHSVTTIWTQIHSATTIWTQSHSVTTICNALHSVTTTCNALHFVTTICNALHSVTTICNALYIQYWCIDGKYRIYVARLRNGGKDELLASLSIRFVPSHINYIFTVNTPILYLSCNEICKIKC
jgi:hypothetical protein